MAQKVTSKNIDILVAIAKKTEYNELVKLVIKTSNELVCAGVDKHSGVKKVRRTKYKETLYGNAKLAQAKAINLLQIKKNLQQGNEMCYNVIEVDFNAADYVYKRT